MVLRRGLEQRMMKLETLFLGEQSESINSDNQTLSLTDRQAVLVMKAFCPKQTTPQALVGNLIWQGFQGALPDRTPPVLTSSVLLAGNCGAAKLPFLSIKTFVKDNVVPKSLYQYAPEYHVAVAQCAKLTAQDL